MARPHKAIQAVIDDYDLAAELGRYSFPDLAAGPVRLNRGTATLCGPPGGASAPGGLDEVRAGHFGVGPAGVVFHSYEGVRDHLVCLGHPAIEAPPSPSDPQVVDTFRSLTQRSFAFVDPQVAVAEGAVPAIQSVVATARSQRRADLVRRFSEEVIAEAHRQLASRPGAASIDEDPTFVVTHGVSETVATSCVSGDRVHRVASKGAEGWLDPTPLQERVAMDGGLAGLLDSGRVPADLVSLVWTAAVDASHRFCRRDVAGSLREVSTRHRIPYLADETVAFGRAGAPFFHQGLGVTPDVVVAGGPDGAVVVGSRAWSPLFTAAGTSSPDRASTWLREVQLLLDHRDPTFLGRDYLSNQMVKGEYARCRLAELSQRFSGVADFSGLGGLYWLSVYDGDRVRESAARRGLLLSNVGGEIGGETTFPIVFLADVLTREIDVFVEGLAHALAEVEG